MLFLAESHDTGDPLPYLPQELAGVGELREAGLLEQMWLKADRSGAVLLMRADDAATVRDAVDSLPLVVNGVTSFEVTELIEA